jgi:hypothetical protein
MTKSNVKQKVLPAFEWADNYYGNDRNKQLAKEAGPLKAERFTGVTEVLYTDLIPYTIIKTFSINLMTGYTKLIIQSDKVSMKSGKPTMTRDTKGVTVEIERHPDGSWRAVGAGPKGQIFYVGKRLFYLDPEWDKPYKK